VYSAWDKSIGKGGRIVGSGRALSRPAEEHLRDNDRGTAKAQGDRQKSIDNLNAAVQEATKSRRGGAPGLLRGEP
jgi:hypothetical protein